MYKSTPVLTNMKVDGMKAALIRNKASRTRPLRPCVVYMCILYAILRAKVFSFFLRMFWAPETGHGHCTPRITVLRECLVSLFFEKVCTGIGYT